MACTFPVYSDITGAQIIAVVTPRTSLGSYDADAIDFDKTTNTVNSIIGLAVQSFNDWFNDIGITITDVSDDDCAKVTLALKLYIAAKYLEANKYLTDSDNDTYPYQDVKHLFDRACELIKETEANISNVADFCKYGNDKIAETWEADGQSKCDRPDLEENFTRGISAPSKKIQHDNLLGLLNDDHPQYLTNIRGNARYYTKAEVDTRIPTVITDHGALDGLLDDDHPQYHTDARGDLRYSSLSHNHDLDYASLLHTHSYAAITGTPDLSLYLDKAVYDSTDNGIVDNAEKVNGVGSAGDSKYYGTNESGTGGFFDLPSGGANPAGANNDIQYKNGAALGATTGFNFSVEDRDGDDYFLLNLPDKGVLQINEEDFLKEGSDQTEGDILRNLTVGRNDGFGGTSLKIRNPGIGKTAAINFGAASDTAGIYVTSYEDDKTEFAFLMYDNPGDGDDFYVWKHISFRERWNDWLPLLFTGYNMQFNAIETTLNSSLTINNKARYWGGGGGNGFGAAIDVDDDSDATGGRVGEYTAYIDEGTTGTLELDLTGFTTTEEYVRFKWDFKSATTYEFEADGYPDTLLTIIPDTWITHAGTGLKYKLTSGLYVSGDDFGIMAFPAKPCVFTGDVELESGVLTISETSTPTAVSGKGKIYTKTDNRLYFQSGDGAEHEIQFV